MATLAAGLLVLGPDAAVAGGTVSVVASSSTPALATSGTDGSVERVRQLVQCGPLMYAVGQFTAIKQGGATYVRNNAFSFSATTGVLTSWNPNVNGQVNSVALSMDCSTVYLGGTFTSVGGKAAGNIAAVQATTGSAPPGFAASADAQVSTLVMAKGHLLVGGSFTTISGSPRRYLASLNPASGRDDGFVDLNIAGTYAYTDDAGNPARSNRTQVYNTSLSRDGNRLLAMGVFTSVGGQQRRQIVMLNLGATAMVDAWYSPQFNQNCAVVEPFWLQDASWAPDGSRVYIATTGYKPANGPAFDRTKPRAGLCDAAAAFSSGPSSTQPPLWVNYTGCDSLYATAADATAVYVGGHERWASNRLGCDTYLAPGATRTAAPGLVGLNALNGEVAVNPTRGRGLGATDMLVTERGLWVASDNAQNTEACGLQSADPAAQKSLGHAGICFLPY